MATKIRALVISILAVAFPFLAYATTTTPTILNPLAVKGIFGTFVGNIGQILDNGFTNMFVLVACLVALGVIMLLTGRLIGFNEGAAAQRKANADAIVKWIKDNPLK